MSQMILFQQPSIHPLLSLLCAHGGSHLLLICFLEGQEYLMCLMSEVIGFYSNQTKDKLFWQHLQKLYSLYNILVSSELIHRMKKYKEWVSNSCSVSSVMKSWISDHYAHLINHVNSGYILTMQLDDEQWV
jgi:hypothetical protein